MNYKFSLLLLALLIAFTSTAQQRLQHRGVPQIRLYYAGTLNKEAKINGTMTFTNANGSAYDSTQMHTGSMQVKGAGNSTWNEPQKPFNLTTTDTAFKKKVMNFMGMPAGSDWRFLADYYDPTKSKNMLAMDISENIGMDWSSDMRKAEVWFNDVYQGLYTPCQKVDKSANRANIGANDFLIERQALSQMSVDEARFQDSVTSWYHSFKEPDLLQGVPADMIKVATAQKQMQMMYKAIFDSSILIRKKYVDYASWQKYGLVQDLTKNPDGFENSMYYTVYANNPLIYLKPLWDFDVAFGIVGAGETWPGLALDYSNPNDSYLPAKNPAYTRLFQDSVFRQGFKERFKAALPKMHKTLANYISFTDSLEATGAPSRNTAKWGGADYRTSVNSVIAFYRQRLYWQTVRVYDFVAPKPVSYTP